MKQSELFSKTSKTTPSDAMLTSHKLLWQGGFVRRFSTGRWALLPLGMRVYQKIMQIIEQEMASIGALRLVVPTLHPIEIWQKTGRDQAFGEEMHVLEDHYGQTFALGATAEGMMAELIKMFHPSHKDLPIEVYQFSSKFRDDKRPRGGLVRVREFMMKDAYNFCADEEQFQKSYQKFYDAYLRIAKVLGLPVKPVLADSGAIGGSLSHEFMVDSKAGDNTYLVCDKCGYAANQERATMTKPELNPTEKPKPLTVVPQPQWVMTMNDNTKHYGEPLWRYLKNVVYKGSDGKLYIASIRGDQEVSEPKLKRVLGLAALEPASSAELAKLGTKHGYVHSWDVPGAVFVGDEGLTKVHNFIGGQKEDTSDTINVNYDRDFTYERMGDIVMAKEGDSCHECQQGTLREKRSFEWGHTFNIGHFYSKPQEVNFTDKDGVDKPLWMGSYGIGLERSMALVVEEHHDKRGIVWPESVAPFRLHLLGFDLADKATKKAAQKLYTDLQAKGIEVLFDDREGITPGEKMADADLIGCPWRAIVSKRSLEAGGVELKKRDGTESEVLGIQQLFSKLSLHTVGR